MGINVLSLFDGISCGQVALNRLGIEVDTYFASEIDKHAIKVTQTNYPSTIQLGDVTKICTLGLPKIDLLIGGSPCQGFSLAGKQLNFEDERSKLFFEYLRILKELKEVNPNIKFLLENVKMKKEFVEVINDLLGVKGKFINSSLVSAQNRPRWYWTNAEIIEIKDKGILLNDILEDVIDDKYFIRDGRLKWLNTFGEVKEKDGYVAFNPNKAKCLTVRGEPSWNTTYISSKDSSIPFNAGEIRKLTAIECERLQTIPDNYTSCISDTQRYKALGNGWTVDIICSIFKDMNLNQ